MLGERILDIGEASAHLVAQAQVAPMTLPNEMRALIEEYQTVSTRLYQIGNYFGENGTEGQAFAFDVGAVSIKAPIQYPWNVLVSGAEAHDYVFGYSIMYKRRPSEDTV